MPSFNTYLDGTRKEIWMPGLQKDLRNKLHIKNVAKINTRNTRIWHSNFGEDTSATDLIDGAYTNTPIVRTDETLTITQTASQAFRVEDLEMLQSNIVESTRLRNRAAFAIAERIERTALITAITNPSKVIDNGNLTNPSGAPSGVVITVSATNPDDIADAADQVLREAKVDVSPGKFMMMRPKEFRFFQQFARATGFNVADNAFRHVLSGPFTDYFISVTNNMPVLAVGTFTGNVSAADTLTIAGVVFTYNAAPSVAGQVDVGATQDDSLNNLVAAINNSSNFAAGTGSATSYFEISVANRKILTDLNVTATGDTTADTLTLTANGTMTVVEVLTNFTLTTTERAILLAGVKGSIFLALPSGGTKYDVKPVPLFAGKELYSGQVYAQKVWTRDKPALVNFEVAV